METKPRLLIVEDDPGLQSQLKWSFDRYEVYLASERTAAVAQVRRFEPPVITLDLGLPPDPDGSSEGLATLTEILALTPHAKIIIVSGNEERANAVQAIALGAYDFYQKPLDPEILGLIVHRAFRLYELEEENRQLAQRGSTVLGGLITCSPQMLKACRTVEKVAPTSVTVLLLGDSGTGKELLARGLHELNPRANAKKFVAINCAAIPDNLLESELFGYEKGAFTGAAKQTKGKIEYAEGGTLFLDEVGDLPLSLQAKLLRFLQERVIERVGGREEIPVDVRVICATHQDLPALVKAGNFREDLYYRISEVTIRIPPLREREGDAVLLARNFLERYCEEHKRSVRGFTPEALAAIESHTWPGNVRELENRLKRAVIMAEGNHITAEELELAAAAPAPLPLNLREVREAAERQAVRRALSLYDDNVTQAAEALGVSRPTLYDLMNKFGLK